MCSFSLFTLVFHCLSSIDVIVLSFLWLDCHGLLGMVGGRIYSIWDGWATLAGVWPAVLISLFFVCSAFVSMANMLMLP